MKLNRFGIVFKYHGDEITRYWPWVKRLKHRGQTYRSSLLSRDFNSFNEYWRLIGEEGALAKVSTGVGRMHGFSFVEVVARWSARLWVNEYLVVLTNPNPGAKGPAFWARLSPAQKTSLMQDVVVLRCKDFSEATVLLDSTSTQFADAFILFNGAVMRSNANSEDWSDNV